jgi:vacuolar-type H+-ATPase subunit H
MAAASPPAPLPEGGLDALRRIKAAETEWEQRLAADRAAAETALQRVRDETEAAVKAAQAEADRERALAIAGARATADEQAAAIVAEGEVAAEEAARGEGKRPADHKDEVLAVVLGEFGSG